MWLVSFFHTQHFFLFFLYFLIWNLSASNTKRTKVKRLRAPKQMAFAPSWGGKYSQYDPNAPVNPKRAKEIFPQDFINIFLRIVGEATTAKVARLTIKELAKKNGGKAGLHDLFIERPLDLSKQLTARQIKYAEKLVNKTREDCAKYVALMEHKRRLAFGAAIRISIYVRGYLAKKLTQKKRSLYAWKCLRLNTSTDVPQQATAGKRGQTTCHTHGGLAEICQP